jgi:hypothetical protein
MAIVKVQVAFVDVRASFVVVERRGRCGVGLQNSITRNCRVVEVTGNAGPWKQTTGVFRNSRTNPYLTFYRIVLEITPATAQSPQTFRAVL